MARQSYFVSNCRGITMVELLVAMAISSILMIGVVAASAFLNKYLANWQKRSALLEELDYTVRTISTHLQGAQVIRKVSSGWRLNSLSGKAGSIRLVEGKLVLDNHQLRLLDAKIDSLNISLVSFAKSVTDSIFPMNEKEIIRGLYTVTVIGSNGHGLKDTISSTVRCSHEYFKYTP